MDRYEYEYDSQFCLMGMGMAIERETEVNTKSIHQKLREIWPLLIRGEGGPMDVGAVRG